MTTQQLIDNSLELIEEALRRVEKPIIAWSGGKDSQVMLYLIRQVNRKIPVLHMRGYEHARKHFFADLMINSLELDVIPAQSFRTDVVGKDDHIEIIETYRLTDKAALYFPIEAEPEYIPGADCHCAIEKLNQPTSEETLDVDCIFIGHRSDDVDPVHGAIQLEQDTVESGGVMFVYPLKDWTEANIWEASELLNIPQNQARYARKDMDANADYFPLCVECLKPNEHQSVMCPKINEPVFAIGKNLNLEQRRDDWRDKFINLRKQ